MRRVALALVLLVAATSVGAALARAAATPRLVPLVRGFDTPVFVTQAPGQPGRFYVVEQGGLIRVVEQGKIRRAPFLDVRSRIVSGGEQGLLGLAFPPDFARTGLFYVNYSGRPNGDTVVVRYRARSGRALASSRRVILTVGQPYSNHNGGHLLFGPDGRLWIGLGRRRLGRRPREPGAEHGHLPREDAAPERQGGVTDARDRGARAQEPVAVQLRPADG